MTLPNGLVSVVDLFSGAGGLSYGFMAHGAFEMIGAADARRRGGSVAYYGHPMARVCRTWLVRLLAAFQYCTHVLKKLSTWALS